MWAAALRVLNARNFSRVAKFLFSKYKEDTGVTVETLYIDQDVKFLASFRRYARAKGIALQLSYNLTHNPVRMYFIRPEIYAVLFKVCF